MSSIKNYLVDFCELLYPKLCAACANHLFDGEHILCTFCRANLPFTNELQINNNKVEKMFWGRVPIAAAASFLFFNKGSIVQHLLHQLKYKGRTDVGELMGKMFAYQMLASNRFLAIDVIIPVPLHEKKRKLRGYNQTDSFANGLAEVLGASVYPDLIIRLLHTETQTKKSRYERFENMNEVFQIKVPEKLRDQNVLLVDDVITTGSTLCACAEVLSLHSPLSIKIAAIASA